MIVFPNCKINLGLRILRKRSDGYHDLETILFPIPLTDALEAVHSENQTSFAYSGIELEIFEQNNLCQKAYELLGSKYDLPNLSFHLHKGIPIGAGLGGGSADAAFTIQLLNRKFDLKLSIFEMIDLAAQLGSDCPFFILNKPSYATGRGEILEKIEVGQLGKRVLALVNPGLHINTSWAFSQIAPDSSRSPSLKELIQRPIETWKETMTNDFEKPVFEKYPEIELIKTELYNQGAVYASLSGSGSSVFGLFNEPVSSNFPADYFIRQFVI